MTIPAFLACPECGSSNLAYGQTDTPHPAPFDSKDGLVCADCKRYYPIIDGVFVMWSDELKGIQISEMGSDADLSQQVKKANIQIYDDVSDEYGEHHDGSMPYAQTQLFQKAIASDFREADPNATDTVIVDVGCATGNGLDVGSKGFTHTVGVDVSLQNLRHTARKGHTAVLADADRLPFKTEAVDLITCFATLHHFPNPQSFVENAFRSLRQGGVLLIAGEPTDAAMRMGPLAKLAWDARKPVYRFLSRYSKRFYMHRDQEQQSLNDLAEINRTNGGFAPDTIDSYLMGVGFGARKIFYGTDPSAFNKYAMPPWQQLVLKTLSLQNPLKVSNWMNLSAIARKEGSGGDAA